MWDCVLFIKRKSHTTYINTIEKTPCFEIQYVAYVKVEIYECSSSNVLSHDVSQYGNIKTIFDFFIIVKQKNFKNNVKMDKKT